jgi:rhodanese-related sulfurtransferase
MLARIHLAELKRLLDDGAQLVEVLPSDEYQEEHLPGALSIPLNSLDARTTAQLDKRAPVIVYCWDELCDLSPRAAHRLAELGFEQVYDYVDGKADWLGSGLPGEGSRDDRPYAGDLADTDPPTCGPHDTASVVRARLEGSRYGYCIVVDEHRVVLGRVRRSALSGAPADARADILMEPGPSTVRFNKPVDELLERMRKNNLATMIVTTPAGLLCGVFHRDDAE